MASFWDWLNTCHSAECAAATGAKVGQTPIYGTGSGETDYEFTGGPGGNPGDFGGETIAPVDPYTGQVIPRSSGQQPSLFGVSLGSIIWVVAAIVVANAAMNVGGGSGRRRR